MLIVFSVLFALAVVAMLNPDLWGYLFRYGGRATLINESVDNKADDYAQLLKDFNQLQSKFDVLSERLIVLEGSLFELSSNGSLLVPDLELEDLSQEELSQDDPEELETQPEIKLCDTTIAQQAKKEKVIINEIAWMGTTISSSNEWIELKNITNNDINLEDWQVLDQDRKIEVIFKEADKISSEKQLLLERTDDESVPGILANTIYKGSLSDTNEMLYLFDQNCVLQDFASAKPDWSAGDKSTRRTMERKDNFDWQTSRDIGGTPSKENSTGYVGMVGGSGGNSNHSVNIPTPEFVSAPIVYPKILISETQIDPIDNRFIELYNPNSFEVDLTEWYIQRKTETGSDFNSLVTTSKFSGKKIGPLGHFLISKLSVTDIDLDLTITDNNSLVLKNPNGEVVDKLGFGMAQEFESVPAQNPISGSSVGRKISKGSSIYYIDTDNNNDDFELQVSTPGSNNYQPVEENNDNDDSEDNQDANDVIDDDEEGESGENSNGEDQEEQTDPYPDVVVNEIAWMGTNISANDEWIELYNNTSQDIDLSGWILRAFDETPLINLQGIILADNYFLLERTSDDTILDVLADQIYVGALSNMGEYLLLYDNANNLIDSVDNSNGWFVGNNDTKQTMERMSSILDSNSFNNWATSIIETGTPRSQNSQSPSE